MMFDVLLHEWTGDTGDDDQSAADSSIYPLGYSETEFQRLERQGALFRDPTEDLLRRAGVTAIKKAGVTPTSATPPQLSRRRPVPVCAG